MPYEFTIKIPLNDISRNQTKFSEDAIEQMVKNIVKTPLVFRNTSGDEIFYPPMTTVVGAVMESERTEKDLIVTGWLIRGSISATNIEIEDDVIKSFNIESINLN